MADQLYRFLFDGADPTRAAVRGELVALDKTWAQILGNHDYPASVLSLLGELVVASTLLSANLKFNGTLIMQIHGDGPVRLLVVECTADLTVRATVKLAEQSVIDSSASFTSLVNQHGRGRFAMTLDPRERSAGQQPYQGIVPLEGDSIAAALGNYMLRSEQLETVLWLAADGRSARGMLLQRLPSTEGYSHAGETSPQSEYARESWERARALSGTLTRDELLALDAQTLMHRLFWQETLRVFDPVDCRFACSCSRERVANMLVTLGQAEVDETLAEQGRVEVHCDFCNKAYEFDPVDCAQLFATSNTADGVRAPARQRH